VGHSVSSGGLTVRGKRTGVATSAWTWNRAVRVFEFWDRREGQREKEETRQERREKSERGKKFHREDSMRFVGRRPKGEMCLGKRNWGGGPNSHLAATG